MMTQAKLYKALYELKDMEGIAKECERYGMLMARVDYQPDGADTVFIYSLKGYCIEFTKKHGEVTELGWKGPQI